MGLNVEERFDEIYEEAERRARLKFKGYHESRYKSYASAVAELCTNVSLGIGPTVRIYATIRQSQLSTGAKSKKVDLRLTDGNTKKVDSYQGGRPGGLWTVEDAMELAEETVFGPLTDVHYYCWHNMPCFDDDPQDVKELNA